LISERTPRRAGDEEENAGVDEMSIVGIDETKHYPSLATGLVMRGTSSTSAVDADRW
jgi:hypothetical protein